MNLKDREAMVSAKNIRSFYGGQYDFVFPLLLPIICFVVVFAQGGVEGAFSIWPYYIFIVGVSLLYLWAYFQVGRLHRICAVTQSEFSKVQAKLSGDEYVVKDAGKFYIEVYERGAPIHITVFLYEGDLYGSAWRYAGRGSTYMPFYTGMEQINKLRAFFS